ncbi:MULTISPECIES: alpha/beta fold hydrolase [Pseudonocardia]|uniref:alpha/beta fold hydrolase n=1 Tax=Pseudonocardia TaxID=1847 RepID=UPI0018F86CB2|nr:alpha/beta hydrolase [Pseudonocardia dioxanivorans]GJF02451.1 hydrolase [Pseudonocardia sp. D17]
MSDASNDGPTTPSPGRSLTVDLGGPVHYVDYGGRDGAALVLVHGLGGSHLNWDLVAPTLALSHRVVAVDLPGFGLSAPGGRLATVAANVRLLERFVDAVVGGPVVVIGNSMGGMIGILMTERSPQWVAALALVDPALPSRRRLPAPVDAVFAVSLLPGVGEFLTAARRRRIGPRSMVYGMLRLCGVDPRQVPTDLIDRSVAMITRRQDVAGVDRAFLTAARSLAWVLIRAGEYRAAMATIEVPVLLLHGDRDALVPVGAARAAAGDNPGWTYVELAGVGHVPQLQVPDRFVDEVLTWLAEFVTAEDVTRDAGR